jgi:hypothetical protein|tara:strand:+ start:251 stop:808 length:558 start_codon:yes stop_codon:yes gene_type:complete
VAKLTLQEVSNILGKASTAKMITKLNPATAVTSATLQTGKTVSKEIFGYDFVGLIVKLAVFYLVAFVFAKIMETIIFSRGAFKIIANTLGFNIPQADQLPDSLKNLFGEQGVKGFKFWDIIKVISILLVIAEFSRYVNTNKSLNAKSSPMTIGIFTLIIITLGLTTIPELYKRVKGTDFNLESLR